MSGAARRAYLGDGRWEAVDVLQYRLDDGTGRAPFRDVTRQVLFDDRSLGAQLRYFEVAPGGWSTLERHDHVHAVLVLRGRGRCLVGNCVTELHEHDLVTVPPMTWHQFRAAADAPLGFLCLVAHERDRPQLPTDEDLRALAADPVVAAFIG
jgi:quercetin dioxygenase-like cupin family protein